MLKPRLVILAVLILITNYCNSYASNKTYTWYKVVSIVDGDTLKIKIKNRVESVRLYGIDAPERDKEGYHKASAVLEELCFGKYVRLVYPQSRHRDKYGRILAEVYLKDNTKVNEELFRRGVVKLYKRSPLSL